MLSHYLVHWDGYQANLQSACERQFLAESFVDVTLAVEAGLIKCHRVVLSAASAYFHQLLAQHTHCPHPIIFMRDMQYWEVIALVDFMYRGEVSVPADKLEQLMKAAQTLQIHGLSSCLRACLERSRQQDDDDSQGSDSDRGELPLEPQVELSTINKLCELNELELRPLTPSELARGKPSTTPELGEAVPTAQRNVVKEEIEFIEDKSDMSLTDMEPIIQIQSVYSEQSMSEDRAENSEDGVELENDPGPPVPQLARPENQIQKFLLVRPAQATPSTSQLATAPDPDPPTYMYKRYSPRSLEQALRDLNSGRFRSIRACARHHGIPMTTLRYRAKVHPKRPPWLDNQ